MRNGNVICKIVIIMLCFHMLYGCTSTDSGGIAQTQPDSVTSDSSTGTNSFEVAYGAKRDESSGELLVEITTAAPISEEIMNQCLADIVNSQKSIENDDIVVSYPDGAIHNSDDSDISHPKYVMLYGADKNNPIVSIAIYKQADPELLQDVAFQVKAAQK